MRRLPTLDLLVKVVLVVLLASALVFPDLSGVKEKAGTARLVVYPLGIVAVPLWWWAWGRRRSARTGRGGFPWGADLLVSLPWLLDTLGNRLDLFDTVSWWDDGMHLLNWALLTAGVLLAWAPRGISRGLVVVAALAFGMSAALLWELGEYATFLRTSPELQTAYTDTLGDLTLGSLGSLVAGVLVALLRRPADGPGDREHPGARRA